MKTIGFLLILFWLVFLGCGLDFSKFEFRWHILQQFLDLPTLVIVIVPALAYDILMRPAKSAFIHRIIFCSSSIAKGEIDKLIVHYRNLSNITLTIGWITFFISGRFVLMDLRPETLGPNFSYAFLAILYAYLLRAVWQSLIGLLEQQS